MHVNRIQVRGGDLKTSSVQLCVGTWNVEGLTDEKVLLLQVYMEEHGIHLLCLQEVRKPLSDYSITETGFLLISSGGQNAPEYAGVGFLVHPKLKKSVQNFCQYSNRIFLNTTSTKKYKEVTLSIVDGTSNPIWD